MGMKANEIIRSCLLIHHYRQGRPWGAPVPVPWTISVTNFLASTPAKPHPDDLNLLTEGQVPSPALHFHPPTSSDSVSYPWSAPGPTTPYTTAHTSTSTPLPNAATSTYSSFPAHYTHYQPQHQSITAPYAATSTPLQNAYPMPPVGAPGLDSNFTSSCSHPSPAPSPYSGFPTQYPQTHNHQP